MADIVLPSLAFEDDAPDMMDMSDAESISDGVAADLHDVEEGGDDDDEVLVHPGLDTVIEQIDALEAWEQADPNALDVGAVGGAEEREVAAYTADDVVDDAAVPEHAADGADGAEGAFCGETPIHQNRVTG